MDGKQAEAKAARFLKKQGLKIITTNFLAPGGELDIIAREGESLVFVEVRFRQSSTYGSAAESINRKKQQRVIKAASHYLQQNNLWDKIACRFDTICITVAHHDHTGLDIHWQKNAFTL